MDHKRNQLSATAAYWASCDRLGDGDTVPVTPPPPRGPFWKVVACVPGLLLICAMIAWSVR